LFQIAPSTRKSNCFSRGREKFLTKEARSK
jgi:hypothetical protein